MSQRSVDQDRLNTGNRAARTPPALRRRPSAAAAAAMLGNRAFTQLVQRQTDLEVVHLDRGAYEAATAIDLSGSVGRGGDNDPADVLAVRERLASLGYPAGDSVEELAGAIESYQRNVLHFKRPDGRVDRGGQTLAGLNAYKAADQQPPSPGPSPTPPPSPTPAGGLEPGDHVWEWSGLTSQEKNIPQKQWFGTTAESDYGGHGKEIYEYVVYPDHVKRGQPHMRSGKGSFAWLNNNPGNLTAGGTNVGEYPGKRNWHNFIVFPTVEAGMAGIPRFLKANGYGPLSLAAAFKRYAPKGDGKNNPEHYAQSVADAIGVGVETTVNQLTEEQLKEVAKAIAKMEGSVPGETMSRNDPRLPEAIRSRLF